MKQQVNALECLSFNYCILMYSINTEVGMVKDVVYSHIHVINHISWEVVLRETWDIFLKSNFGFVVKG